MQDPMQNLTTSLSKLSTNAERSGYGPSMPPPLRRLGCANQSISSYRLCPNDATQSCGGCFLVRYCSKECQTEHWKSHKQDCKSPLKSKSWSPMWVKEDRKPAFVSGPNETHIPQKKFGIPMGLWGNMMSIDVINAKDNEGADKICDKDLSLAFIASGDLRNVVRTVNELPENYTGTLKIVLNDKNCRIVCRNFVILTILGIVEDVEEAAEQALHFWYSVFQPLSYRFLVFPHFPDAPTLQHLDGTPARLTSSTTVHTRWDPNTTMFLISLLSGDEIDLPQAKDTWSRTMYAPERIDHRERHYTGLRPSHRVAFDAWRRSGLLLPFGAMKDHMCVPNAWLFSGQGDLLLNDSSNPLEGWDYTEVVKAGKEHGTTADDLMGGMFFYVKDQLVEFSKRLRRFKIHIYSYDKDAKDLPTVLRSDMSSPKTFDRIETSNITDKNYVGLSILSHWGPLLNGANPHAAIIGLFMNWTNWKKAGEATSSMATMHRAMKEMASCKFTDLRRVSGHSLHNAMNGLDAFHDTSIAFQEYLNEEKADMIARKVGLKCRRINKIVPHRCFAELGTSPSSLPCIDTPDKWYAMVIPPYALCRLRVVC
ncbi:hypothetical protein ARMSODRAFT_1022167 [Armillaria solidipes]|uniref:MYND-type domain-containing protein n=1 Tax=Armillaria solidipes TaxID=1076256 RepID=A0A2H3BPE4_9AGAR|nr:hypothetical protein ARMSODRAFT_1022167 [Armillaria solidipes]